MAEVIHFTPRADLDAQANLAAFVQRCRNESVALGARIRFDDDVWDITDALALKGKNSALRLVFSTWATVNDLVPTSMAEPFLSFAKAYMRYQHGLRPTKSVGQRMSALRALEAALVEMGHSAQPTACSPDVLNRAAQLIKNHFTATTSYRVGGQLQNIADFLITKRLCATAVPWRNPIQRPRDGARVGKEFDEQRQAKLPSPAALEALAKVFRLATEPADVLVSSIAAILCSAPGRINEVLALEVGCEVTHKVPSSGETSYGLRWYPSKGAEPMVKWVVRSMASVVQDAINNIRSLTEEAREVARWYEANPDQLFLPPHLEHLRGRKTLSMPELRDVLFKDSTERSTPLTWCNTYSVATTKSGNKLSVRFSDVEKAVLMMLPKGFPIADAERGLRYSEALCVVLRNTMHGTKSQYRGVIDLLEQDDIYMRLGAAPTGRDSIFDKFGFTEDDGRRIRVRSHQFRHYLNTLAQRGGLSQLDIAKWSGRGDINQNKVYDHESGRDILARVRELVGDESRAVGPLARAHTLALIPRGEFARLKVPTAHTTEFGYCIHDFTMLPCQIHRDCMNCDEQVCIKGEGVREANIRRHRDETRTLLREAQAAMVDGDMGANRWVEHQSLTLERLDQLCAILDDPSVPAGAVIQLSKLVPASRIAQAEAQRAAKGIGVLTGAEQPAGILTAKRG